jgi:hypothetical protein
MLNRNSGFSLVETILVTAILITLMSITWVSALPTLRTTYLSTSVDTMVSDIKRQQLKAMTGFTEGRTTHDHYGVRLEANRYVLFHGSSYSSSEPTNQTVSFQNNVAFQSAGFPSSQIIFTGVTGEISGFTPGANTITLKSTTTDEQKVITFNRYGVVVSIL